MLNAISAFSCVYPFFFFFNTRASVLDSNDCKHCGRVLAEIEHIDDEADGAGIKFVKIDDKQLAKQYGVFALPAILFFKMGSKEPVIYAGTRQTIQVSYSLKRNIKMEKLEIKKYIILTGDLYEEEQILQWLLTQKDPSGEVIEALEGEDLLNLIRESESLAVYFCKLQSVNNFSRDHEVNCRAANWQWLRSIFSSLFSSRS